MSSPGYLVISEGWRSEPAPDWPTARAMAMRWALTAPTIIRIGRRRDKHHWDWVTLARYERRAA